jgi:hypothetical protein
MSFLMLVKSYKGLSIVKAEPKNLGASPRSSNKTRNEHHVNMVEYSSESSNDKEADMCVAKWNCRSKSKLFVCSS